MASGSNIRGRVAAILGAVTIAGAGYIASALAEHVPGAAPLTAVHGPRLVIPIMNPMRGKKLFVAKGCIACHAVNGVGGHDAPNMDAHTMKGLMNPFDFAAKMWNHAPGMIAAQEGAFGTQIYFTGDELADIIAFVHDDATQHTFTEKDLTAKAKKLMKHEHGERTGPGAHAKKLGHHPHAPGAPPHKH